MIEVGFSEPPPRLTSDARFWLSESNGDVQMVITIKVEQSLPKLVFESRELINDRLERQQVVTIRKGDNNHIYIENQPFIIGFDKLFLRPASTARETDIHLDKDMLKEIGRLGVAGVLKMA